MNDNEIKVSQLTEATDLNENDLFMIVQNGVNKKLTGNKIGGNEIVISTTEDDITAKTKLFINSLTKEAKFRDGNNWETLAGDEVLVSATEPTSDDNKLWIDTTGTMPYINSEIAIGSSNDSNIPVWFKKSNNLFDKNSANIQTLYPNSSSTLSGSSYRSVLLSCNSNTTYTIKRNFYGSTDTIVASYSSIPVENSTWTKREVGTNDNAVTITTGANDLYLLIYIYYGSTAATLQSTLNGLMVQLGSTATAYEPYTAPSIIADNTEFYSKPVVLWTNPSPTSNFNAQNLVIDNYRKLDIIYRIHTSSENQIVMSIYNTGALTEAFGIYNDKIILRQSSYSNDTLSINQGVIYNSYGSPTTAQNDVMIPLQIIGYK